MKVLFLGTAAAEAWPALFCKCDACMGARKRGGKNIRTRSSCLIDDIYMVDFGPDTYHNVLKYNLELDRVEHLFVTHSHEDHFYPQDIQMRKEPYAHIASGVPMHIYGNDEVKKLFDMANYEEDRAHALAFSEIYPFKPLKAGQAEVVPLLANHKVGENCYVFLITINGKTLLYGHDSGYFPEKTWEYIRKSGIHIDAAILDNTHCADDVANNHMGFGAVQHTKQTLTNLGCADDKTIFVVTHFSHNAKMLHEEIEEMVSPYGYIVAYDGMTIEF